MSTTIEDTLKKEISHWFHECQHWHQKYKNLRNSLDPDDKALSMAQLQDKIDLLNDLLYNRQMANSNKQID